VTERTTGGPETDPTSWRCDRERPKLGGNVRWGVTNNFTLNATVNPDYSQIESDEGQLQFDPRQALFFAESGPSSWTVLSISPRRRASVHEADRPAGRGRQDHGRPRCTRKARVHPHRPDGGARYNRVASLDARRVFRSIYSAQAQYAHSVSRTTAAGPRSTAPLWNAVVSRNGKSFKMRYAFDAVDERFRTQSGFIGRGGIAIGLLDQWYTHYLPAGGFLESVTLHPALYYTWRYQALVHQGDALEKKLHNRIGVTARGGWRADMTVMTKTFGFDPALYAGHRVLVALEIPPPSPERLASAIATSPSRSARRGGSMPRRRPTISGAATRTSSSGRRPTSCSRPWRPSCGQRSGCVWVRAI
jgi:hypothetical protein